jgi:hypothetical protein
VICDFGSRLFSLVHTVSGAHVPWMCPPWPRRLPVRADGFTDDRVRLRSSCLTWGIERGRRPNPNFRPTYVPGGADSALLVNRGAANWQASASVGDSSSIA